MGYTQFHKSLIDPVMMMGIPRKLFFMNVTLTAAAVIGLRSLYMIPLALVLHVLCIIAAKFDTEFLDVGIRHLQYKDYYDV